jgi:hypothetical protein
MITTYFLYMVTTDEGLLSQFGCGSGIYGGRHLNLQPYNHMKDYLKHYKPSALGCEYSRVTSSRLRKVCFSSTDPRYRF